MDVGVFAELEPVGVAEFTYKGTHVSASDYMEAFWQNVLIALLEFTGIY